MPTARNQTAEQLSRHLLPSNPYPITSLWFRYPSSDEDTSYNLAVCRLLGEIFYEKHKNKIFQWLGKEDFVQEASLAYCRSLFRFNQKKSKFRKKVKKDEYDIHKHFSTYMRCCVLGALKELLRQQFLFTRSTYQSFKDQELDATTSRTVRSLLFHRGPLSIDDELLAIEGIPDPSKSIIEKIEIKEYYEFIKRLVYHVRFDHKIFLLYSFFTDFSSPLDEISRLTGISYNTLFVQRAFLLKCIRQTFQDIKKQPSQTFDVFLSLLLKRLYVKKSSYTNLLLKKLQQTRIRKKCCKVLQQHFVNYGAEL